MVGRRIWMTLTKLSKVAENDFLSYDVPKQRFRRDLRVLPPDRESDPKGVVEQVIELGMKNLLGSVVPTVLLNQYVIKGAHNVNEF